jgi:prepilin peptidase CpaA
LPPLVLACVVHGAAGGLSALGFCLFGLVASALVPYLLFRKGAIGGGDVKLFAAFGALGGATFGLEAQLFSLFLATLFVMCRTAADGQLLLVVGNAGRMAINPLLPRRHRRSVSPEAMTSIRLGVPIFFGTMVALAVRFPGWERVL